MTLVTMNDDSSNYEYSVDNQFSGYQTNNEFHNLTTGEHEVFVRDKNQCSYTSQKFYILGFPEFFTPNNDGVNDFWTLKGLDPNLYHNVKVCIFDRFGKLLYVFDPNDNQGWNGKNGNEKVPSDDYWFTLKSDERTILKGHFTLKR